MEQARKVTDGVTVSVVTSESWDRDEARDRKPPPVFLNEFLCSNGNYAAIREYIKQAARPSMGLGSVIRCTLAVSFCVCTGCFACTEHHKVHIRMYVRLHSGRASPCVCGSGCASLTTFEQQTG